MSESQHKVKKILGICVNGFPFFFGFLILTIAFQLGLGCYASIPMGIVTLWCLWFFRDPDRFPKESVSDQTLISPADGKIIKIEEVDYPYLLNGKSLRVSVFMNIFNVHVNRIPLDGKIIGLQYHEGKFFSAYADKASLENEQMGVVLVHGNKKIMFVQIAGLIARRILCRLENNENVFRGQRFGLIRFGSRVDIYLPLSTRLFVKTGDTVLAGESKIAEL